MIRVHVTNPLSVAPETSHISRRIHSMDWCKLPIHLPIQSLLQSRMQRSRLCFPLQYFLLQIIRRVGETALHTEAGRGRQAHRLCVWVVEAQIIMALYFSELPASLNQSICSEYSCQIHIEKLLECLA